MEPYAARCTGLQTSVLQWDCNVGLDNPSNAVESRSLQGSQGSLLCVLLSSPMLCWASQTAMCAPDEHCIPGISNIGKTVKHSALLSPALQLQTLNLWCRHW